MTRRRLAIGAGCALLIAGAVYLRDPPWAGQITSGMRGWEKDRRHGELFRWTAGRASFFVPSGASAMTLPLRAGFPGPNGGPVTGLMLVWAIFLSLIYILLAGLWFMHIYRYARKTGLIARYSAESF